MERVFSKPAASSGSAGVDDRHDDRQASVRELADGPAGNADYEAALRAVDRAVRSLPLREPLDRVAPVETAGTGCLAPHHPDSAAVFRNCQCRHPAWNEFPDHTIRVIYQRLLRDRWEATILERISREPPATVKRVMRQIEAIAPAGREPGDEWWVWCELEKTCPQKGYGYTASQVRAALKRVTRARRRLDFTGKGSRLPQARRIRRLAIAPLAADLHRPLCQVKVLDVDDYDAVDGTVLLRDAFAAPAVRVSVSAQARVDAWLRVRGGAAGLLFALPNLPAHQEQACSDPTGLLESAPHPQQAAAEGGAALAELIELCCQGQSQNVCRYLLCKILERGDWPAQVLQRLREIGDLSAGDDIFQHGLSKKQVHLCRAKLQRRLARMGILKHE